MRDAFTHMTGKNVALGPTHGKRRDAGVTHRGRRGRSSVGSVYDESWKIDRQGGFLALLPADTHREASGPHIEPRGDLRVLVRTDYTGRGAQIPVTEPRVACSVRPARNGRAIMTGSGVDPAAQAQGAVDDGAPYRYGFGERVWETFACARGVDENDPVLEA